MYYKQGIDVDVFLPVEAGKKMKAPVELVDKTFTMRYKPVYHFNFGLIAEDGVKRGAFASIYGLDRNVTSDMLLDIFCARMIEPEVQDIISAFYRTGKVAEKFGYFFTGNARNCFLKNSYILKKELLSTLEQSMAQKMEVLTLKEELVSFELSLGNKRTRKKLLDSLVAESSDKQDEWKEVFGPEIYEMKTGQVFGDIKTQIETQFKVMFSGLHESENHGKALNEIAKHGIATDKSFVFLELEGAKGKNVTIEAYRGIDYRNWDGNAQKPLLADELVVRGVLPKQDLEKVFAIMRDNPFLKDLDVRAFDNAVSKDSLKLYKDYKANLLVNDVPFDVDDSKKAPLMTLAEGDANYAWNRLKEKTLNNKDAAVLMGDTPWRTKEELLAEKRKFVTFRPETGSKEASRMNRGWELQKDTADRFSDKTGIELSDGAIYQSDEKPIMTARISHMTKDGNPVLILSTGNENGFLWENGSIPSNVVDELQWDMAVTGTKRSYVACLVDNLGPDGNPIKGIEQVLHIGEVKRDEKTIAKMTKEVDSFEKEMTRAYLLMRLPKEVFAKKDKMYEVMMPDKSALAGTKVMIPEKYVKENAKTGNYQLVLPIKNSRGQSYLYRKDDGKSVSSAEIYCAINRVRGRVLFANNRATFHKNKGKGIAHDSEQDAYMGKG